MKVSMMSPHMCQPCPRSKQRLKRNEVPPRTGANRNKQENPTYAERPREQKDSTFSPHSPRTAPRPHSPRAAPLLAPYSPQPEPPQPPKPPAGPFPGILGPAPRTNA